MAFIIISRFFVDQFQVPICRQNAVCLDLLVSEECSPLFITTRLKQDAQECRNNAALVGGQRRKFEVVIGLLSRLADAVLHGFFVAHVFSFT